MLDFSIFLRKNVDKTSRPVYNMCKVFKLYTFFMGDNMDKNVEFSMLYDIYGKLLTAKQQEIFEEYYLFNLSLREIAENKKISYQAVRDSIKSSETALKNFEKVTHTLELTKRVEGAYALCETEDLNSVRTQLKRLLRNEDDI